MLSVLSETYQTTSTDYSTVSEDPTGENHMCNMSAWTFEVSHHMRILGGCLEDWVGNRETVGYDHMHFLQKSAHQPSYIMAQMSSINVTTVQKTFKIVKKKFFSFS